MTLRTSKFGSGHSPDYTWSLNFIVCPEKKRLTAELTDAMKGIISIHNQEMEAVLAGQITDNGSLCAQLQKAIELKDRYREELKQHTTDHGC